MSQLKSFPTTHVAWSEMIVAKRFNQRGTTQQLLLS
jgi:hypothetical protein